MLEIKVLGGIEGEGQPLLDGEIFAPSSHTSLKLAISHTINTPRSDYEPNYKA